MLFFRIAPWLIIDSFLVAARAWQGFKARACCEGVQASIIKVFEKNLLYLLEYLTQELV